MRCRGVPAKGLDLEIYICCLMRLCRTYCLDHNETNKVAIPALSGKKYLSIANLNSLRL